MPFNPEVVLEGIRKKQARLQAGPRTPSPEPLPLKQRTPQGPNSVVKYGEKLQRAITRGGPKAIIAPEQLQRFIKGSIANALKLELVDRDLKAIQEATAARQKRASLGGTVASKAGVIKASQCRELCSKRKKKEEEQARKKKEREEKKAEKARVQEAEKARVQAEAGEGETQANPQRQVRNPRTSQLGQIAFLLNAPPLEE
ncbi:hypothetical protein MMC07_003290 [Pseudocyphellaria aurata]|nr:hypothetical protein [Pseudocyphellaria aurata]